MSASWEIRVGDCRDVLRQMPAGSVHTCVCSPPYFGLRDYGTGEWESGDPACDHLGPPMRTNDKATVPHSERGPTTFHGGTTRGTEPWKDGVCGKCGARRVDRQIGLEPSPDDFVAALVAVFREVRRVLRDDGTVWLNLGDSYADANRNSARRDKDSSGVERPAVALTCERCGDAFEGNVGRRFCSAFCGGSDNSRRSQRSGAVKAKDLLGIPWMVAFALRADGWYLRSDIVWSKPNPMPESVTDRPTKSHEYLFLLSKGPKYHYDADAIREADAGTDHAHRNVLDGQPSLEPSNGLRSTNGGLRTVAGRNGSGRNKRSVWTVATQPYANAHFATYPPKLIEPCILAGAPERACGECGAPWVRVVDVDRLTERDARVEKLTRLQIERTGGVKTGGTNSTTFGIDAARMPERRTVGFEPSCSHGDGSARGVVLDPFAGAGTTGLVALQHGREFVGIELKPEYAAMARERIKTAVRLGFRSPQNGPAVGEGQASLFDSA